jgi:hypothetical protein
MDSKKEYKLEKKEEKNQENQEKLLKKYIHDIRNMKYLNKEMLNKIESMSSNNKMEIIITFNEVVDGLMSILHE